MHSAPNYHIFNVDDFHFHPKGENPMSCPVCESDEWKLASLLHKEGVSHISTTTASGLMGGGSSHQTKGTQQSAISKEAAPPSGYGKTKLLVGLTCIFLILALFGGMFTGGILYSILTAASAYGVFAVYPREKQQYQAAMAQWKITRMCQRCGTFYQPS